MPSSIAHLRERELDAIALAIRLVAERVRLGAVGRRVDVRAAGEKHGVELLVHAAQRVVVDERNQPRNGARSS